MFNLPMESYGGYRTNKHLTYGLRAITDSFLRKGDFVTSSNIRICISRVIMKVQTCFTYHCKATVDTTLMNT